MAGMQEVNRPPSAALLSASKKFDGGSVGQLGVVGRSSRDEPLWRLRCRPLERGGQTASLPDGPGYPRCNNPVTGGPIPIIAGMGVAFHPPDFTISSCSAIKRPSGPGHRCPLGPISFLMNSPSLTQPSGGGVFHYARSRSSSRRFLTRLRTCAGVPWPPLLQPPPYLVLVPQRVLTILSSSM